MDSDQTAQESVKSPERKMIPPPTNHIQPPESSSSAEKK